MDNLSTFCSKRKIVNASKATSKNFLEDSLWANENGRIEMERSISFDLQRRTDARRQTINNPITSRELFTSVSFRSTKENLNTLEPNWISEEKETKRDLKKKKENSVSNFLIDGNVFIAELRGLIRKAFKTLNGRNLELAEPE